MTVSQTISDRFKKYLAKDPNSAIRALFILTCGLTAVPTDGLAFVPNAHSDYGCEIGFNPDRELHRNTLPDLILETSGARLLERVSRDLPEVPFRDAYFLDYEEGRLVLHVNDSLMRGPWKIELPPQKPFWVNASPPGEYSFNFKISFDPLLTGPSRPIAFELEVIFGPGPGGVLRSSLDHEQRERLNAISRQLKKKLREIMSHSKLFTELSVGVFDRYNARTKTLKALPGYRMSDDALTDFLFEARSADQPGFIIKGVWSRGEDGLLEVLNLQGLHIVFKQSLSLLWNGNIVRIEGFSWATSRDHDRDFPP